MERSVVTFGSISKSTFGRVLTSFFILVNLAYSNAISKVLSALILCNLHDYKLENFDFRKENNVYIKDLKALKNFDDFLC